MSSFLVLWFILGAFSAGQTPTYNLGRTPTDEEIRAWDLAIGPAGRELPPGQGTAKEGAPLYGAKCAVCHGPTLTEKLPGGSRYPLVGGQGTLTTLHPVKTIGNYWPFATSIWDIINRSMPRGQEGTLTVNEVYALTAFILFKNDLIEEDTVINAESLPKIRMPNRDGFIPARLEDIDRLRCKVGTCP